MGRFDNKVCVIVGAASEIGTAVAQRLSTEGGIVVGIDLVDHSVGELRLIADFTVEDDVVTAYDRVVERFGRTDEFLGGQGGRRAIDQGPRHPSGP
jgi:NAD(P)-dependent dehydrogenase (short-subunit alcohol dehydrogenase family)